MKSDPDQKRGLYQKFKVTRTDGSSKRGGKHHKCVYFVLDLVHDYHAREALRQYALSCEHDYPKLAIDIRERLLAALEKP